MTDREILSNVIDKAIANGWDSSELGYLLNSLVPIHWNLIIFSHSFAKAFFGEKPYFGTEFHSLSESGLRDFNEGGADKIANWQLRLQQMVLEENPIKYLERFL